MMKMEYENFILKHYHETGEWLADCVGTGPGVGGGPDSKQQKSDVAKGSVGDDLSSKTDDSQKP